MCSSHSLRHPGQNIVFEELRPETNAVLTWRRQVHHATQGYIHTYTYIYIHIHRYMNRQHSFCNSRKYSQQAESDSAHVHIPLRAASTWPCNPHASQRAPRASPTRRRREQHFSEVTHKTMGLIVVVQRKIVCGTLACDMFRTVKHSTPQTCQRWEGFGLWQEENW